MALLEIRPQSPALRTPLAARLLDAQCSGLAELAGQLRQGGGVEWNKILGAFLGTCTLTLGVGIAAEILFEEHKPEKPGYELASADPARWSEVVALRQAQWRAAPAELRGEAGQIWLAAIEADATADAAAKQAARWSA